MFCEVKHQFTRHPQDNRILTGLSWGCLVNSFSTPRNINLQDTPIKMKNGIAPGLLGVSCKLMFYIAKHQFTRHPYQSEDQTSSKIKEFVGRKSQTLLLQNQRIRWPNSSQADSKPASQSASTTSWAASHPDDSQPASEHRQPARQPVSHAAMQPASHYSQPSRQLANQPASQPACQHTQPSNELAHQPSR